MSRIQFQFEKTKRPFVFVGYSTSRLAFFTKLLHNQYRTRFWYWSKIWNNVLATPSIWSSRVCHYETV